ncbi:MAG: PD40 domain-containing protein [Anaerolineales bacterium]|nr:PD40 domain-containing protein [Anaerolineales bacterium]
MTLPLPAYSSWDRCASGAILYHSGVWDYGGAPAQAQVLNWETGYPQTLPLPGDDEPYDPTFSYSPDCRTVALADQDWIYLFDVDTTTLTKWTAGNRPAYSPDGQTLALERERHLILKDVASGDETVVEILDDLLSGARSSLTRLSWGSTGTTLLLTLNYNDREPFGEDFVLVDLNERAVSVLQSSTGVALSAPSLSPERRYVAYVNDALNRAGGSLRLYAGERACVVAEHPVTYADEVFWTPDGTRLLVTTWPGTEGDFLDVSGWLPTESASAPCLDP